MGFQKSPSSFTRSQSEEHVESFGPSLLQKHNVNHVMCITFKFHPLIQEKTKKEKRKERLRIPIKILYYIILYPTVGTLLKNLEIFVGF